MPIPTEKDQADLFIYLFLYAHMVKSDKST